MKCHCCGSEELDEVYFGGEFWEAECKWCNNFVVKCPEAIGITESDIKYYIKQESNELLPEMHQLSE